MTPSAPAPHLTPDEVTSLTEGSSPRMAALRASLAQRGSALVAFSGGVDSALVLKLAVEVLGDRAVAMTARSASIPDEELAEAKALAESLGARHLIVDSKELDDPRYAANPTNRCYFCKTELYTLCERVRREQGLAVVLDGFNADDAKDHRPGHQAAREHEVVSPLREASLTKREVRAWSQVLGLPTWDKPQMACLASRLPYGTQVTVERLNKVGAAERAVRALGLSRFRVRHHGDVARLEVSAEELPQLDAPAFREAVSAAVKACGYTFVAVDLEPFRSGRLNDALPTGSLALPVLS